MWILTRSDEVVGSFDPETLELESIDEDLLALFEEVDSIGLEDGEAKIEDDKIVDAFTRVPLSEETLGLFKNTLERSGYEIMEDSEA